MEFVKLTYKNGYYSYVDVSSIKMNTLENFLTSDASPTFREWALADKSDPNSGFCEFYGGNIIGLEEEYGYIFFTDDISDIFIDLIMSREQFVQLLTDWEEKVFKLKPKNVILIHRNDTFIIETNNYDSQANYVNLMLKHNFYERIYESSFEMAILGFLLSRDVRWDYVDFFKRWATEWKLGDKQKRCYAINDKIITLERSKDYLYFTNENPDDDSIELVTYFKITTAQFLQLLDDWQEKVCDKKPREIIIKYENDEFIIETKQ